MSTPLAPDSLQTLTNMEMKLENLLSLRVARAVPRQVDLSELVTQEEYRQLFQEANNAVDTVILPDHLKNDWSVVPLNYFNVYLGETFTFYIVGTNDSTMEAMVGISIRIDMQIGNKAILLKEIQLDRLEAKMSLDALLAHEIKEPSTHMLICTIGFTLGGVATGSERQTARKYFQFPITKPIDVKTKLYFTECDEVYLETIFQNLTTWPIQLTNVVLESNDYDVESLNFTMSNDNRERHWIFGKRNRLASNESRQYLFSIKPKEAYRFDSEALRAIYTIGKLDIVWLSAIGERGHIQTSQLEKNASTFENVKVLVEALPDVVHMHKVFKASLRVINCSRQVIRPLISLANSQTAHILWLGSARRTLAELKPREAMTEIVFLYPTAKGIYDIPPLTITELANNLKFDFKKLAFVNVV